MSDDTQGDDTQADDNQADDTQPIAVTPADPNAPMLVWGAATHAGRVRTANEDDYVAEPMVFGVADGMGGHAAGEVASEIAARTLRERLGSGASHVDVAIAAVVEANASIFQTAHTNSEQHGMGTTLTALVVLRADGDQPPRLALLNVGDSRTYVFRNGQLRRATKDHSYVQELVDTGHITEVEARTHPRRNIVTRALGIEPTVQVDTWVVQMVRGDRFVLCSDGLVDEVPDDEIADIAAGTADPQLAAEQMVALANAHGGRDNTTVIVVDVHDGVEPPPDGTEPSMEPEWTSETAHSRLIEADAPDPTSSTPDGDTRLRTRRFGLGTFLFMLALAVIATVTITLVAVVINNRGDTPPTPTTSTTSTTSTTTTSTSTTSTSTPTTIASGSTPGSP